MQIKVNMYFQGRLTNEQQIKPDVYEVGDPRLFGLESYLVDQGKAVYLESESVPIEPVPAPVVAADEEIEFKGRKLKVKKAAE